MTKVIMTNSFRGGTGKSTIISNLGSYLATFGFKVVIIDGDVMSPGVHAIFGLSQDTFDKTLTDYMKGTATIAEAMYDISENLGLKEESLFLIPSSILKEDIAELFSIKGGSEKLARAIPKLIKDFEPDFILMDTHPGINEEVLVVFEQIDMLLNIVRPDNQDYQGLEVSSAIAKRLKLDLWVIMNKVHPKIRNPQLQKKIEEAFDVKVAGMIPLSEDIVLSESQYIFIEKYPGHEFSVEIETIAANVFNVKKKDHLELMRTIIQTIKKLEPVNMKTLETTKNIYIPNALMYFENMVAKGFINEDSVDGTEIYSVTKKGDKFMKKYKSINKFVDNFRL